MFNVKKKILAFLCVGVLFFAFSINASALVVEEAPDIPDFYYNRPETIILKKDYDYALINSTAYNNGSSVASGSSSVTSSSYTSANFIYFPVVYDDGYRLATLPFLSLDDKEKYKITVKFKVNLNGSNVDDVYAHLYTINGALDESDIKTILDNKVFTSEIIINSSDLYSSSSLQPLNGVQPVTYFGIKVIGDLYGELSIKDLIFKCEIYDSSDAMLEEDYGFQAEDDDINEFASTIQQFSSFLGSLEGDLLEYCDTLPNQTEAFLDKLEPFRLFITDIYDIIPDWFMWLLSFCLSVIVMRRIIR